MRRWAWLAIALQCMVLVWVAAQREWIMARAPSVWLRTMPVDPRDPFRGDFVALDYEIAHLSVAERNALSAAFARKRQQVYASLEPDARGVAKARAMQPEPFADGRQIRGRVGTAINADWRWRADVKFGIEKLFVEQGAGLVLEQQRGQRDDWQRAMEVEVALSGSGTAAIKGYRWSPIAIKLEVVEAAERVAGRAGEVDEAGGSGSEPGAAGPDRRLGPKLRLWLRNEDQQDWLMPALNSRCAWELRQLDALAWSSIDWAQPCVDQADDRVLQPGQEWQLEIDFALPEWQLQANNKPLAIGQWPETGARFRLVYRPRPANAEGARPWPTELALPAFNGNGRID